MSLKAVETRKFNLIQRIKDISKWNVTPTDKRNIKEFIREYKAGDITQKIGNNIEATVEKVLQQLRPAFEHISENGKNTISKFTKKDVDKIKKFKQQLLGGKIGNYVTGDPYPKKTIKQIFLAFSLFLAWKFKGEDDRVILIEPLKVKIKLEKKDPKSLSVDEILQLYRSCRTPRERYVIANLFSSGQRAKEFHNNRYEDITLPEKDECFVRLQVRKEFTKTNDRKIPLLFNKSIEASREFLQDREKAGITPTEPIVDWTYDTLRKWLKRLGKTVLNKNINYQIFRSSCAKWLVDVHHYNRYQLCYFMGWHFSSPMADVYIQRSDAILQTAVDKAKNTEMEKLEIQIEKQDHDMKLQNEKFNNLQQDLEKTKMREKILSKMTGRQKKDLNYQLEKIHALEKSINKIQKFDALAVNLFKDKVVQEALLKAMIKKGYGKELWQLGIDE